MPKIQETCKKYGSKKVGAIYTTKEPNYSPNHIFLFTSRVSKDTLIHNSLKE